MNEYEIKEILKKQEETLVLIQKLWRAEKWRRFWMIFKYSIFVLIVLGGFYFVQPYLGGLFSIMQNVLQFGQIIQKQNPQELQKFLDKQFQK